MEKTKEVVGTIDRVHELSLDVAGVVTDSQIATVLAFRERLFGATFIVVVHFSAVGNCIYKMRANKILSSDYSGAVEDSSCLTDDLSSL
jgi:hypothetical protein